MFHKSQNQPLNPVLLIITALSILVMFGSIAFLFLNIKDTESQPVPTTNQVNTPTIATTAVRAQPDDSLPTDVLIGKGTTNDYRLIDPNTGEVIIFMPEGHTVLSPGTYENFPEYVLTKSNNRMHVYRTADSTIIQTELVIETDQEITLSPSISENSKFYLSVQTRKPDNGLYGFSIVNEKNYFFDALENTLIEAPELNIPFNESPFFGCSKYDSKHARFFAWPCGEGVGQGFPLSVFDIASNSSFEAVSASQFEVDNKPHLLGIWYSDGQFFAMPKVRDRLTTILRIDATKKDLASRVINIDSTVQLNLPSNITPRDILWHEPTGSLAFSLLSGVEVLRVDDQDQIASATFFPEPGAFDNNYLWSSENGLFFQSKGFLRTINLVNLTRHNLDVPIDANTPIGIFKRR